MGLSATAIARYTIASLSGNEYEVLVQPDESLSCDCPGWTRKVDAFGRRSCRHCEAVKKLRSDQPFIRVTFLQFLQRFKLRLVRVENLGNRPAFGWDVQRSVGADWLKKNAVFNPPSPPKKKSIKVAGVGTIIATNKGPRWNPVGKMVDPPVKTDPQTKGKPDDGPKRRRLFNLED